MLQITSNSRGIFRPVKSSFSACSSKLDTYSSKGRLELLLIPGAGAHHPSGWSSSKLVIFFNKSHFPPSSFSLGWALLICDGFHHVKFSVWCFPKRRSPSLKLAAFFYGWRIDPTWDFLVGTALEVSSWAMLFIRIIYKYIYILFISMYIYIYSWLSLSLYIFAYIG